jgi:hypothetical protein
MVFRVMSLIPERTARVQSGSMFDSARVTAHPERIALITRFLGWLGPLELDDADESLSDEDRTVRLRGPGTQIAA